jgi:hypothetical protein
MITSRRTHLMKARTPRTSLVLRRSVTTSLESRTLPIRILASRMMMIRTMVAPTPTMDPLPQGRVGLSAHRQV